MGDRLTQLQDAADELAKQFIAAFYYLERHHDLELLGPGDKIPDLKQDQQKEAGQLELARDLIVREQQIEYLISSLPGLDNSEAEQEQTIKELEEDLRVAETQRLDAVKEKDEVLAKLDHVVRGIRRH